MDKRLNFKKRSEYPVLHNYGNISNTSLNSLRQLFGTVTSTLGQSLDLREAHGLPRDTEDFVKGYDQLNIQKKINDTDDIESNYTIVPDTFEWAHSEITSLLKSDVCRMRYATLEPGAVLDYHIDQPIYDRFILVIEGEHTVSIKKRKELITQVMKPGELWYLNSNWEHRVDNNGSVTRIAVLGCFNYGQ